jgi:hypothetical protein
MQQRFTVASLRSLQSNGYAALLTRNQADGNPHFGETSLFQDDVNENVQQVLDNLDRV